MTKKLALSDCKSVREVKGTHGGNTFYIRLAGWSEERPVCFRRKTKNTAYRCSLPAGHGTWHLGEGACKYHGGRAGRIPTHGRAAKMMRRRLAEDVTRFMEEDADQLMDLSKQLATMHVLFQRTLDNFPDYPVETAIEDTKEAKAARRAHSRELNRIVHMIQATGSLVDKISKIESRNALTAAQVLYLRVTMTDILMRYIIDPTMREAACAELAHRVGGRKLLEGEK